MRSSWAKGPHSLRHKQNLSEIESLIRIFAKRFHIRIYRHSVNSNHIHLVMRPPHRDLYKAFVRALSAKIAMHVMKGQSFKNFMAKLQDEAPNAYHPGHQDIADNANQDAHGKKSDHDSTHTAGSTHASGRRAQPSDEPQGKGQRFWQFRPFTRVMHWGKDFKTCCEYIARNINEALGFIDYTPRKDHYARWFKETFAYG